MRLFVLALLAAAALPACGDLIGPRADPAGTVSFRYGGARSGAFYTRGEMRTDAKGRIVQDSFAYGLVLRKDGTYLLSVNAFQSQSLTHGTGIHLYFPFREPGVHSLSCSRPPAAAGTPETILGGINFDTDRMPDPSSASLPVRYGLVCGRVHVTRMADGRAQGTFEARGLPYHGDPLAAGDTLYVTGGSFDVPLREWKGGT